MGRPSHIRSAPPRHSDPASWYRRGEVAKLLNCTRENVYYLQTHGSLHPRQDAHDEWRFDPDEVHTYASTHPRAPKRPKDDGEIAAASFEMFERGSTRRQVVIALRITTERADALYEEWGKETFDEARAARAQVEASAKHEREERERTAQRQERLERASAALGTLAGGRR